jgi:5'-3' exonuclease
MFALSKVCAVILCALGYDFNTSAPGLKRLEDGSLVKDWEEEDKETDFPVQMSVKEVSFEDERFMEQGAPTLDEEFPVGTMVFFLGEHGYGVVAQVQDTIDGTLSVTLAVRDFTMFP